MKRIVVLLLLSLLVVSVYAEPGTIHLVFTNGIVTENEGRTEFAFDVQAWMSEGSDVLSDGMVYVEYPTDIFGDVAAMNGKVNVEKTGILALKDPEYGMDLYSIVNVTDTYADVFAITFTASMGGIASYKPYYEAVSTDPDNPSDLLRVVVEAAAEGTGEVSFPDYISGLDELYWDYEYETFDGGLDIAAAVEAVVIGAGDEPEEPEEPEPAGYVELQSFTASLKKSDVNLNWTTITEQNNAGFVIKRSENGGDYVVIASYETDASLEGQLDATKRTRYAYTDKGVSSGTTYTYMLESVDIAGNVTAYDPVTVTSEIAENTRPPKGRKKIMIGEDFALETAFPNPFNPRFVVPFELNTSRVVDIRLFDMSGKLVREIAAGSYAAGTYEIEVDCDNLGSGIYLLVSRIGSQVSTQRMSLLK
jgi:hypothetical protein